MKSIRLNKEIRLEIVNNIMASYATENPEPPEVPDSETALDAAVYDWAVESNKDLIKIAEDLHSKYSSLIKRGYSIQYVTTKGSYRNVYHSTKTNSQYISEVYVDSVYLPSVWDGVVIKLDNPDTKIPAEIQTVLDNMKGNKASVKAAKKLVADYNFEYLRYKQDVSQVIDGCNTSKQLLEVWKEVEQFLPVGVANPSSINLPAVSIASLNRKLGKSTP